MQDSVCLLLSMRCVARCATEAASKAQLVCVHDAFSCLSTAQLKISTRKGRFDNQQFDAARVRVNDGVARAQTRASLVIRCIRIL